MYQHSIELRVRYGETDKMAYLYYVNYAEYLEVARVEAIRHLGFSYKKMEDELNILLPVVEYHSKFIRPAYYDDVVTLSSSVKEMPDRYIIFETDITNAAGKLINSSQVKLAFVDAVSRKAIVCPDFIIQALQSFF